MGFARVYNNSCDPHRSACHLKSSCFNGSRRGARQHRVCYRVSGSGQSLYRRPLPHGEANESLCKSLTKLESGGINCHPLATSARLFGNSVAESEVGYVSKVSSLVKNDAHHRVALPRKFVWSLSELLRHHGLI